MCGIVGLANRSGSVNVERVEKMRDSFPYRGPDDCGLWSSDGERVVLGHRRLSIIDRSHNGHQPMIDPHTQCVVVFNGEVYNYRESKKELESAGHVFHTSSDTEVVLRAYVEFGHECVNHFNGMFAIAIWDPRVDQLFLLRDRLGIKPLYYYHDAEQLIFASECKAIDIALEKRTGVNICLLYTSDAADES